MLSKLMPTFAFILFTDVYENFRYHYFVLFALSKEISLLMTAAYICKWKFDSIIPKKTLLECMKSCGALG